MLKFKRNIGNISPPQARKNNTRGCYLGGGFTLGGAVLQTPLWVGLRLGGSCFIFGARGRKNCPKINTQKIWPSPQLKKYLLSLRFPAFCWQPQQPHHSTPRSRWQHGSFLQPTKKSEPNGYDMPPARSGRIAGSSCTAAWRPTPSCCSLTVSRWRASRSAWRTAPRRWCESPHHTQGWAGVVRREIPVPSNSVSRGNPSTVWSTIRGASFTIIPRTFFLQPKKVPPKKLGQHLPGGKPTVIVCQAQRGHRLLQLAATP